MARRRGTIRAARGPEKSIGKPAEKTERRKSLCAVKSGACTARGVIKELLSLRGTRGMKLGSCFRENYATVPCKPVLCESQLLKPDRIADPFYGN